MSQPSAVNLEFRLSDPSRALSVGVRLRSFGHRWVATAEIDGQPELGLGTTARAALRGALCRLREDEVAGLLADPVLFGASAAVVRAGQCLAAAPAPVSPAP